MKYLALHNTMIMYGHLGILAIQTARDGKIYMSSRNGTKFLHVIHSPDKAGEACDFRQHDYELPTVNARAMPYFPNYRLGSDPTYVSTEDVEEGEQVVVYPNPAQDYITIKGNDVTAVTLRNLSGQIVIENRLITKTKSNRIDVSSLNNGLYLLEIVTKEEKEIHKIVIHN